MTEPPRPITFRATPTTYTRLVAFARKQVWSLNTAVEQLLGEALTARDAIDASPTGQITPHPSEPVSERIDPARDVARLWDSTVVQENVWALHGDLAFALDRLAEMYEAEPGGLVEPAEVESLRAAVARVRVACAVTCDDPWVADDATETAARILRALDGETVLTVEVAELATCERCDQPIARHGDMWIHTVGGHRTPCPRACPPSDGET